MPENSAPPPLPSDSTPVYTAPVIRPLDETNPSMQSITPEPSPTPDAIIPTPKTSFSNRLRSWQRWSLITLLAILLIFLIGGGVVAAMVLPPAQNIRKTLPQLNQHVTSLKSAAKQQDLTLMQSELNNTKSSLDTINTNVDRLAWFQNIPYVNNYWRDAHYALAGGQTLLEAGGIGIESLIPYADLVGFKTATSTADPAKHDLSPEASSSDEASAKSGAKGETAQDRIQFVVGTVDKLVPQLDRISSKLQTANDQIKHIDPNRYPENFRGTPIRGQLQQLVDLTREATILVTDARPLLEIAPYLLGNDKPRQYLVLFQNDAELRPTGGFLTAYALMQVDKGKITPKESKDIYDLDQKYHPGPAPEPILKYLPKVTKWNLRDMNLSPDFKISMDAFYAGYKTTGSPQVDGVIAVDSKFLVELLKVTGPIGVGEIGNFSAETVPQCNCPQVVYELESAISVETPFIRENRKAIIGPLMHSVLANAMGTPKDRMAQLVQTGLDAIKQKHVIMYYLDPQAQTAIEAFNLAGRVVDDPARDYLMIVDTNFAGAKSNLYVEDEVDLKITTSGKSCPSDLPVEASAKSGAPCEGGSSTHELTITYKNPQKHDGWLNGDFRNWVRVYVPLGAKLLDSSGSETAIVTSEDLGKTVFEGFLVTRPMGLSKLTLKYETQNPTPEPYQLLIQKQGGTKNFFYTVNVNDKPQEFELDGDKKLTF